MIKKYIDANELKEKLCFDKRLDAMACGDLRKVLEIIEEVSFSADMDRVYSDRTCENCIYKFYDLSNGKIYCRKRDQVYSKNCICECHEYKEKSHE